MSFVVNWQCYGQIVPGLAVQGRAGVIEAMREVISKGVPL